MADKTINDLTAVTTLNSGDMFELETTGNNSRKITSSNLAAALKSLSGGITLIEEYTGDGTTGTKTFSGIAGTYKALRLEWVVRGTDAAATVNMVVQFNGDTTAIYDRQHVAGAASTASAAESLAQTSAVIATLPSAGSTANYPGTGELLIPSYADTTFNKQGLTNHGYQSGTTTGLMQRRASTIGWRSTAAITSMVVALSAGNYVTGSKLRLYGIS